MVNFTKFINRISTLLSLIMGVSKYAITHTHTHTHIVQEYTSLSVNNGICWKFPVTFSLIASMYVSMHRCMYMCLLPFTNDKDGTMYAAPVSNRY